MAAKHFTWLHSKFAATPGSLNLKYHCQNRLHGFSGDSKWVFRTSLSWNSTSNVNLFCKRFQVKASEKDISRETSSAVDNEMMLLFYKIDLSVRRQRALNMDQFEPAQVLTEKITQIEEALSRLLEGRRGEFSKEDKQDLNLAIIQMKADLQKAIEEENYAEAAKIRDRVAQKESEIMAASLARLSSANASYQFRLGQKVVHRSFGYLGVVCGMDPVCCESEEWSKSLHLENLPRGREQPFYKILVDSKDSDILVTYVPEDNLEIPENLGYKDTSDFNHPYVYLLFYGTDAKGDFIPVKTLREVYNAPRYEIPNEEED